MPIVTLSGYVPVSSPPLPDDSLAVRGPARRYGEEWYLCGRCGKPFPRSEVVVQLGLIVCTTGTSPCYDEPGYEVERKRLDVPRERPLDPLPTDDEEI